MPTEVTILQGKEGDCSYKKHPSVGVGWWNNPLCVIGKLKLVLIAIDVGVLKLIPLQHPYYRCTFKRVR